MKVALGPRAVATHREQREVRGLTWCVQCAGGPGGRRSVRSKILTSPTEEGKARDSEAAVAGYGFLASQRTRLAHTGCSRAGHEVGRAPVGGVVGGEGGAAAGAVAAHDQRRVGVAADQDLGRGLAGQPVVAEQRRQSAGTPSKTAWPGWTPFNRVHAFGAFGPVVVRADGDRQCGLDRGVVVAGLALDAGEGQVAAVADVLLDRGQPVQGYGRALESVRGQQQAG